MTMPRWGDVVSLAARNRLITALVAAHVILKLVLLRVALATPIQGDELTYNDGARALANTVRDLLGGHAVSTVTLSDHVIGNGWFMPGMSMLLTPLYLLDPTAGDDAV